MLASRQNRLFPLGRLQDEIENVFGNVLGEWPALETLTGTRTFPALNLWEDNDNLFAEAEVPGLTMNDIEVVVMGNELTLKGQRAESDGPQATFHRRERGTGAFQRIVRLPVEIDANGVEANLKNGVLTIKLPKSPAAKPRKIEVKTGGA